jgi:hypothetical protein
MRIRCAINKGGSPLICLLLLLSASAQSGSAMPRVEGQSLTGNKVVLPDAAVGKITVLILGFTRASKTPTSNWAKQIRADFANQQAVELYQIPVLEDVPRLIRGMVISGIKKGVPENQRDHFIVMLHSEAELKNFVGYQEPDDAYLVVLASDGKVAQQLHGRPEPQMYSRLKEKLHLLLDPP